VCSQIDAEWLNSVTLSNVETGRVEDDYCRFDLIDQDGALQIEVAESGLDDPIESFKVLMRLNGDVYTTTLADGGVLGIAMERDLFVIKDGINLWKVSAPIGAVNRDVLSRIGSALIDTIVPRDIDPAEIADAAGEAADGSSNGDDDGSDFDDQAFCDTWTDLETSIDRVLEAPDIPSQMSAATESLALFAANEPPDGEVFGWDDVSVGLVGFAEGAEIDDFAIMEEGLELAEPAETAFNIWLFANC